MSVRSFLGALLALTVAYGYEDFIQSPGMTKFGEAEYAAPSVLKIDAPLRPPQVTCASEDQWTTLANNCVKHRRLSRYA